MSDPAAKTGHRGAGNRAKMLGDTVMKQIAFDLLHDETGSRDLVAFYLSCYCGLRAGEIAKLEWRRHVLDASGQIAPRLTITKDTGKKGSARVLDIPPPLRNALLVLREARPHDRFVFHPMDDRNVRRRLEEQTGVKPNTVVKFFERLYARYGLIGCSSHSGRRSAITKFDRLGSKTGRHSFRDTMEFAGHKNPQTTMIYIDPNEDRAEIVEALWGGETPTHTVNQRRAPQRRNPVMA